MRALPCNRAQEQTFSVVQLSDSHWTCQQNPVAWMVIIGQIESVNDTCLLHAHTDTSLTWLTEIQAI